MSENVAVSRTTFHILIVSFVAALVVGSFLAGYVIGGGRATGAVAGNQVAQAVQPAPTGTQPSSTQVSADDDPSKGDKNAPLKVIEFSDFQCPFCGRFFQQTLPQLEEDYIKTGKVPFVYRDFPLEIHPEAEPAANAAGCANEQGRFWEFHDKLFQNQQSFGAASYRQWARGLGLNGQQFDDCLDSGRYLAEIQKDLQDGIAAGVGGTPTFFIGNEQKGFTRVVGAQPYAVVRQAIDEALGGK